MQLRSISFQSSSSPDDRPFSQRYHHTDSEIGLRFLRLIEHLERHIEAPHQWICTSHYDLHFFSQDLQKFAGLPDNPHWTLAVQFRQTGFTVMTHLHPLKDPENMQVEHPETIEETAHLVADILRRR